MDNRHDLEGTYTGLTQCLIKSLVNVNADIDRDVMLREFISFSNLHVISMAHTVYKSNSSQVYFHVHIIGFKNLYTITFFVL